MFRLLVSAGGTGGGVYPALAIVAALGSRADVLWVGGEGGMEASLVQRAGHTYEAIPAAGVHGVGLRQLPGNAWRLVRGVPSARNVIRRFRPDALLFTGGYVGVPVALAGGATPKAVYVPDIEPGLALRAISRRAQSIAVTVEDSRRFYPSGKHVIVTGYPIRSDLRGVDRAEARQILGLGSTDPVLLVYGGSRGAHSINLALWSCLRELLERAQVLHLSGELDGERARAERATLPPHLAVRYHPFPYLHEEMGAAFASADLAVCRAGASTLGELPLFGLPAILVPYPYAWRYQKVNADYLALRGAAIVVEDERLGEVLLPTVESLLVSPTRLETMAAASRDLARPGAARAIADELERLASGSAVHG